MQRAEISVKEGWLEHTCALCLDSPLDSELAQTAGSSPEGLDAPLEQG